MKKFVTKLITFILLIALCFNTFACGSTSDSFDDPFKNESSTGGSGSVTPSDTPFDDPFAGGDSGDGNDSPFDDPFGEVTDDPFINPFEREEGEITPTTPFEDPYENERVETEFDNPFGSQTPPSNEQFDDPFEDDRVPEDDPVNPFINVEECPQITINSSVLNETVGYSVEYVFGEDKDFYVTHDKEYTVKGEITKPDGTNEAVEYTDEKFTFTPDKIGTYTLKIYASDKLEPEKELSGTVRILVGLHTISLTKTDFLGERTYEAFDLVLGTDFTVSPQNPGYTYSALLTYENETPSTLTFDGSKFSFVPEEAGNYYVLISVTDELGNKVSAQTINVQVINQNPVLNIVNKTKTVKPGATIEYVLGTDFTVTHDREYVLSATLSINGGTEIPVTFSDNKFSIETQSAGSYALQIRVTDKLDDGEFVADSAEITVSSHELSVTGTAYTIKINETITFSFGEEFSVSPAGTYTYTATYKEPGSTTEVSLQNRTDTFTLDPEKIGDYIVSISATDDYGNKSTKDITVTVKNKEILLTVSNLSVERDVGGTYRCSMGTDYSVTYDGEYVVSATYKEPGSSTAINLALTNNDIILPLSAVGNYTIDITATDKSDSSTTTTKTITVNSLSALDYATNPVTPTDYQPLSTTYGATSAKYTGKQVISKVATAGGKTYLEVKGKAFPYIGTQIRTDMFMNIHNYTYSEIKVLFNEAKKLGVSSVQIPLEWTDLENEKDQWDFTYIDQIMSMSLELGLKVEFLWFGTNMCGDTHSYSTPSYILRDGKTYPKLDARRTGEFWNYYGFMYFMNFSNPNLIARESNAITMAMNHIYEFDSTHGGTGIVIGMQILNEANMFFGYDSRLIKNMVIDPTTGNQMKSTEGLRMVKESLDALGKAVKNSNYVVYTRTNFADGTNSNIYTGDTVNDISNTVPEPGTTASYAEKELYAIKDWAVQIYNLEGIDIVGDDSYKNDVRQIKGIARMYRTGSLEGNFSHFAENAGNYENTADLILAAFSAGAGYSIYDLVTPDIVDNKQGILNLTGRAQVSVTGQYGWAEKIIKGIVACGEAAALATDGNFAMFNGNKTINLQKATVQFTGFDVGTDGFRGFAIVHANVAYIFCTKGGTAIVNGESRSISANTVNTVPITERNQTNNVWENIA